MAFAGYPNCGVIELHSQYIQRAAIQAQEALFAESPDRFEKALSSLEDHFAKLSAEVAEMRARRAETEQKEAA